MRDPLGTIRARLTAGSAILLAGIAVVLCVHAPARVRAEAETSLARQAQTVAVLAAAGLVGAVEAGDAGAVQRVVDALAARPAVVYAIVMDHGDRMLAAHDALAAEGARFRSGEEGRFEAGGVWRASAPIGDTGGRIHVGLALSAAEARAAEERAGALVLALLVFALGTGGIYLIAGVLTGPLRDIGRMVDRVSSGDLTARTELRSRDELGWLGRSFDTMVARLEEAYGALQTSNRDLEGRVAERTRMLRREVDERRRAEEALRGSERRFRSMFESAAVGIALIDRAGEILEGNASLGTLLGAETEGLKGTAIASLVDETDRTEWERLARTGGPDRDPAQAELRVRTADGRVLWARVVVSGVAGGDGEPERAIVMFDDITERKALEEQLRQSQKLEAVGRLAGGIAHDFNNLLTTINGLAEVLVTEHAGATRLHEDLDQIRKAGERAAALTAQLLAFSRKQIVLPEEIDLNAAIRDMLPMLERLVGPNVAIDLDLAEDLHGLRADPGQIAQVVMNLVVNARDAMPRGGRVALRTVNGCTEGNAEAPVAHIIVSDHGSGMDAGTIQRIFEPFFTTKEQGRGTGLGLSTVYGIVQQSGGRIHVDSAPGRGALFDIALPSLGRRPDLTARAPARPDPRGSETILVVEDEEAVRDLVGRILRKSGYTVLEGRDGLHALDIFHRNPGSIHAVLTDVVMPHMSGPELVRRLVREQPGLRILYMSGYTQDEALQSDLDPHSTGFIQKPMSPHTLTRKLREILDARAAA